MAVLFVVAVLVVLLALATVAPVFLVWDDRREVPPRSRRVLGRVAALLMFIVVIAGLAAMFFLDAWAADQDRACRAEGGTSYSPMGGCR
jgi:UDP-N-acetylmuramyl pentapeptide phosphotransferase/UDP-N-acetylglucosamine-1-phosphate transferase